MGSLTITLPPEMGDRIHDLAREQHRSPEEIVLEACGRHLARLEATRQDEMYRRGYETVPEETADLESLLPHLPLPDETWP
jgi:predicted transcriptional regulator